jgi:hypothetical protein
MCVYGQHRKPGLSLLSPSLSLCYCFCRSSKFFLSIVRCHALGERAARTRGGGVVWLFTYVTIPRCLFFFYHFLIDLLFVFILIGLTTKLSNWPQTHICIKLQILEFTSQQRPMHPVECDRPWPCFLKDICINIPTQLCFPLSIC